MARPDYLGARRIRRLAHRPRRIGGRPPDARYSWERGNARCQMQTLSTGKFHGAAFKRSSALVWPDRSALSQFARLPGAQQHPLPIAEIVGMQVSFRTYMSIFLATLFPDV